MSMQVTVSLPGGEMESTIPPSLGKWFQDTSQSVTRKVMGYIAWGSEGLDLPMHNPLPSSQEHPEYCGKNKVFPLCVLSWVILLNYIPTAIFSAFLHGYALTTMLSEKLRYQKS